MTQTLLVTGAGGYLGTHVVRAALDIGQHVIAVHRARPGVDPRAQSILKGFEHIGDDLACMANKPDVCIHLAWTDGFSHDSPAHIDHLPAHVTFVRTLMEAGVKRFAGLGTMHEIGYWEGAIGETTPSAPRSLYGIAKAAMREAARLHVLKAGGVFQWLRAYYITGDDTRNKSLFSKILGWEAEGKSTFPFTSGKNKYDFIDVEELGRQIVKVAIQTKVTGVIECCKGTPLSLRDKVESFIRDNGLAIAPEYGAFPDRAYDSPGVWGDASKIQAILNDDHLTTSAR